MRPVLLFDADCGFCTRSARFAQRWLRPDADVTAWQDADLVALGLTPRQCDEALQWVDAQGRACSAQRAVARLLRASLWPWRPLGHLLGLPGVDQAAGWAYRLVAANRQRLPGGTPACALPPASTPPA